MPYKDLRRQRAYQRDWMRARRAEYFKDKVCVTCGSNERLELDHKVPATKLTHNIWSWSQSRREAELAKCQPLCRLCHRAKSILEMSTGEHRIRSRRKNLRKAA